MSLIDSKEAPLSLDRQRGILLPGVPAFILSRIRTPVSESDVSKPRVGSVPLIGRLIMVAGAWTCGVRNNLLGKTAGDFSSLEEGDSLEDSCRDAWVFRRSLAKGDLVVFDE